MIMLPPAVWYGHQTLWHIGAVLAASLPACPCARSALRKEIIIDMISTCFLAKQVVRVIAATQM